MKRWTIKSEDLSGDFMKFFVGRASKRFDEDVLVDEAKPDVLNYDNNTLNVYSIEINSLEELMDFYNKYGKLVIRKNIFDSVSNEILIYDDYIE